MSGLLKDNVAIVSGGLGDIGRAVALELAKNGADVAIGDLHDNSEAADLLDAIQRAGQKGRYDRVNVSEAQEVWKWIDDVSADLGVPTLIIPAAAIVEIARFAELEPAHWRKELSVNLDGPFYLALAATQRLLVAGRSGRVVFVGSWAAHAVHVHIPTYCVAKAGLRMLARCMAAELASKGILVNEIAPGFVDGGLAARFMREDPTLRATSLRQVPICELIKPEEVALQVVHLCDPRNRHMTGSTLLMDGGLSLIGLGCS